MRDAILCALRLWALASAASASPGTPVLEPTFGPGPSAAAPATPGQLAAAHAEAAALLVRAAASELFDDVTVTAQPALRHKASGLVCSFHPGAPINKILVFRSSRGVGVGCNTGAGQTSYSIFLDPSPIQQPPVEQLAVALGGQIRARLPDAKPVSPVMTVSGQDAEGRPLPPHAAVVFTRQGPAGPTVEREVVGYVGRWVLQQRITEPEAESAAADLLNELSFILAERAILQAGKAPSPPDSPRAPSAPIASLHLPKPSAAPSPRAGAGPRTVLRVS